MFFCLNCSAPRLAKTCGTGDQSPSQTTPPLHVIRPRPRQSRRKGVPLPLSRRLTAPSRETPHVMPRRFAKRLIGAVFRRNVHDATLSKSAVAELHAAGKSRNGARVRRNTRIDHSGTPPKCPPPPRAARRCSSAAAGSRASARPAAAPLAAAPHRSRGDEREVVQVQRQQQRLRAGTAGG